MTLPMRAAAVLVWLEPGRSPDSESFHVALDTKEPPHPNPEAWWELQQAIIYAIELENKFEKLPWIKVGELILTPKDIQSAYNILNGK